MKNYSRKFSINSLKFYTLLFLAAASLCKHSFAQELQQKIGDWSIFQNERSDRVVCYTAATPIKSTGNYANRGEPFFLVTNLENDADEISASSGFIYNKNSDIEVSFESKKFYLFPYKSLAWANNKNDDIDIIKEMQKSSTMIVSGIGRDGKNAIDTYSLNGFAESYEKLKNTCRDLR